MSTEKRSAAAIRREALADALAQGKPIEEAMREVGYAEKTARGGRIKHGKNLVSPWDHPEIAERVKEIRAVASERSVITIDSVTDMMLEAYEGAKEEGNWGTVIQASMGLAKLRGLIVDRKSLTILDKPFSEWSVEEKIALRDMMREHYGTDAT